MALNRPLPLVQQLKVASPCPVRWDDMQGDDRKRYCSHCQLHVFNISALSDAEAEELIERTVARGERLCGVLFRRADGSVMTRDCPVGVAAVQAALRRRLARVAAALGVLVSGSVLASGAMRGGARMRTVRPFSFVADWLSPAPQPPPGPPFGPVPCPGMMALGKVSFQSVPSISPPPRVPDAGP